MSRLPVYLDNNATTPVAAEVLEAMLPYLREHFGNPSSSHVYGRTALQAMETARAQVGDLLGAHPDEIVFPRRTSGLPRRPSSGPGSASASVDGHDTARCQDSHQKHCD